MDKIAIKTGATTITGVKGEDLEVIIKEEVKGDETVDAKMTKTATKSNHSAQPQGGLSDQRKPKQHGAHSGSGKAPTAS